MDLLGFFVWALLALFPPLALRQQVQQTGMDLRNFWVDRVPWRIKQIKSFFVGRLLALSVVIMVTNGAWAYTLYQMEPQLADWVMFVLVGYSTLGQLLFAIQNFTNGRLLYRNLPNVTAAERALARRSLAEASAAKDVAIQANRLFETECEGVNPLAPLAATLIDTARRAGDFNMRVARMYSIAANAQAVVHQPDEALMCAQSIRVALDKMVRIMAIVPGDPVLGPLYVAMLADADVADQWSERAMREADRRVFVRGPLNTRWSRPDIWLASVLLSMLAMGMYTHVYAVMVEDRWLCVMSYIPYALCFLMARISAEVLAWLVLKGTKIGEFFLTKTTQLATAVLPGHTLASVGSLTVNVLEEEKIAAAIKEGANLTAIVVAPYAAIVFWITCPLISATMFAVTMFGAVFGWLYITRGKKTDVDENTTKTIGLFWKYGKLVTVVVFLLGASVEWDGFMNRLAGITPMVIIPGLVRWYLLFALLSLIVMWAAWKGAAKLKGTAEKVFKPVAVLAGVVALLLIIAPAARAAVGGEEAFQLSANSGPEAEKPVDMTPPIVTYEKQTNGREQLVISFYSKARQAKGVVEFDPVLAAQLGVDRQVKVKTYRGYVNCGNERCRHHEVRIPELKSRPHGTFKVIMRRWRSVEVGEETTI